MNAASPINVVEVGWLTRFWTVLRAAAIGLYSDNCFGIAKGAAYSALLAFFPILTTLASLLVQANADRVSRTIVRLLFDVVPPGTEDVVRQLFNVRYQRPSGLLATGFVLAAWAGSGVMVSLMEGFRAIYRIPTGRSFVSERIVAILLVIGASVPLLGASLFLVFGNQAQAWFIHGLGVVDENDGVRGSVRVLWRVLSFLVATAGMVVATSLLYYFGPNRKQRLGDVLPGAFVAMALWLVSTLGVAWYFRHITDYNVLYGSVGAGLALLVWCYVLAVIAFFGCEFNAALELHRQT